jgi:hypothetical protein
MSNCRHILYLKLSQFAFLFRLAAQFLQNFFQLVKLILVFTETVAEENSVKIARSKRRFWVNDQRQDLSREQNSLWDQTCGISQKHEGKAEHLSSVCWCLSTIIDGSKHQNVNQRVVAKRQKRRLWLKNVAQSRKIDLHVKNLHRKNENHQISLKTVGKSFWFSVKWIMGRRVTMMQCCENTTKRKSGRCFQFSARLLILGWKWNYNW